MSLEAERPKESRQNAPKGNFDGYRGGDNFRGGRGGRGNFQPRGGYRGGHYDN